MKNKIKAFIFDLGGVLVGDFSIEFFRNAANELGVSVPRLKRIIRKEEIPLQKGEETSLQFWHRICRKMKIQCPANKLLASLWVKSYRRNAKINRGTLTLAKSLRVKYPVGMISNAIREHTMINKRRGLFQYFNPVLLSHNIGLRKPQKEIFLLMAKKMDVLPQNILFIDDELRWVKAARKAGLQSIVFKSPEDLKNKLEELKVL